MRLLSPPKETASGASPGRQRRAAALERAEQLIEARFAPAFVVLGGSEAAGSADAGSDIDLLVVSRKPETQRLRWRIFDVRIDVFVQTPQSLAERARARASPHLLEMCASGRMIAGEESLFRTLRDTARAAMRRRDAPSDRLRFRFACEPFDLLRDAARIGESDRAGKALVVNALVGVLLDIAYAKRGVPKPKLRDRFRALTMIDPAGAALLEAILDAPVHEVKLERLAQAVRHFAGEEPSLPELATQPVAFPRNV